MPIKIYDIDGTLTLVKGDKETPDPFETYAFWPLISYHFAENPDQLKQDAEAWDKSDKGVGDAFIKSSADMLQQGIQRFKMDVGKDNIRQRAKEITLAFIEHGIVREQAVAHLRYSIESGDRCILSTGSYLDGAMGFAEALVERGLLPSGAVNELIISGAVVDWEKRTVLHANIAANKIKGLYDACRIKECEFDPDDVVGIYVDDPEGNDSGICELNKEAVRLIKTVKNQSKHFTDYPHTNWDDINAVELKSGFGCTH